MREHEMTKEERTQGRHRLGRGKKGSASISSGFLRERRSEEKRERKDFGEGQRWRCAS